MDFSKARAGLAKEKDQIECIHIPLSEIWHPTYSAKTKAKIPVPIVVDRDEKCYTYRGFDFIVGVRPVNTCEART